MPKEDLGVDLKKRCYFAIKEMIENRNPHGYSLNELYAQIGITRQAVHQHFRQERLLEEHLDELMPEVEAIRYEHPGCGVEQMYHLIQPN